MAIRLETLALDSLVADPASPEDGSLWYRSDIDQVRVRINGITVDVISSGGHVIQDEGGSLTQRPILNFIGAGVVVTDNPGNDATDITIIGQGSYAETIIVWIPSGDRFYADVTHNLGTPDVLVTSYVPSSGLSVGLDDVDRTGDNVIRCWSKTNTEFVRVVVYSASPPRTMNQTISVWAPSGGRYYGDVAHNFATNDILVHAYTPTNSLSVGLDDIERTNTNTVRIWSATNTEDVRVTIFA